RRDSPLLAGGLLDDLVDALADVPDAPFLFERLPDLGRVLLGRPDAADARAAALAHRIVTEARLVVEARDLEPLLQRFHRAVQRLLGERAIGVAFDDVGIRLAGLLRFHAAIMAREWP